MDWSYWRRGQRGFNSNYLAGWSEDRALLSSNDCSFTLAEAAKSIVMINPHLILEKYAMPVPRYTSYPTAPQFQDGLGQTAFVQMQNSLEPNVPVSVYIHIPYCDRLCWFCGCHTKHTLKYAPIQTYVASLTREIDLLAKRLPFKAKLGALHFGGGSPSLLRVNEAQAISDALHDAFTWSSDTEVSVEIDPSDGNEEMYDSLAILGLTRASIGVQDFHEDVQAAINRPQSYEVTAKLVSRLRAMNVQSINIDALYGLPRQTMDRLLDTIKKCVSLQPDRLALFGYAHVPWLKKHQQLIAQSDLPNQIERFEQAKLAAMVLVDHGYQQIGIDHFAKPDDTLAIAQQNGKLRRNFQGYTVDNHETLFGLGASSIGRFEGGYLQNIVATKSYETAIAAGVLPLAKGLLLSNDDKVRGFMIERLMCDFSISASMLDEKFGERAGPYLQELEALGAGEMAELCIWDGSSLAVPQEARPFVRIVAAQLDAYFTQGKNQYSKAV